MKSFINDAGERNCRSRQFPSRGVNIPCGLATEKHHTPSCCADTLRSWRRGGFIILLAVAMFGSVGMAALPATAAEEKLLAVPFVTQIPYGTWTAPWSSACEEADIVMVERYYAGVQKEPLSETVGRMNRYFAIQNKLYGANRDSSAYRTADIINGYAPTFTAYVKENPTLTDIEDELRHNRPVLVPVYGKGLKNADVPFARGSSSYHMIVLIGLDEDAQQFIAHEPAMRAGSQHRYSYQAVIDSLHDYVPETDTADGAARAIFTQSKKDVTASSIFAQNVSGLVKSPDSSRLYWINDGQRYYISHPRVVRNHGWSWKSVRVLNQVLLQEIPLAGVIDV